MQKKKKWKGGRGAAAPVPDVVLLHSWSQHLPLGCCILLPTPTTADGPLLTSCSSPSCITSGLVEEPTKDWSGGQPCAHPLSLVQVQQWQHCGLFLTTTSQDPQRAENSNLGNQKICFKNSSPHLNLFIRSLDQLILEPVTDRISPIIRLLQNTLP